MSLANLSLSLRAVAKNATEATEALKANTAAQVAYTSALEATLAEKRDVFMTGVGVKGGGFDAGGVSVPIDVIDLLKSYSEIAKAIRSMGATARDIAEGKIALSRLEDLIRRFGNPDFVSKIDWQELRGYGSRNRRKTTISTSAGTSSPSLSTLAAQGKMGLW